MHSTAEALDERTPLLLHTSTDASSPPYTDDDQYPDGCRISRRASHRSFVAEVERTRRARFTVYPRDVSLVLENSGSVARDHLASERTFLAYVRTSLTIASAAVALAQLLSLSEQLNNRVLPFDVLARPIAIVSIILALYVLFVGVSRYFSIQGALTQGKFPATRFRVGIIALGFGVIISSVFGLLLAERMMGY